MTDRDTSLMEYNGKTYEIPKQMTAKTLLHLIETKGEKGLEQYLTKRKKRKKTIK